ncbi:MAG: DUF6492 family protein [Halothiobacillaceae bacterium]
MQASPRTVIMTPTWAGDLAHFKVMRASLERSPLAGLPHYVVVQDEDLELFSAFRGRDGLTLLSTRDVLPEEVERRRVRARQLSGFWGRHVTRISGSMRRVFHWPQWPAYTGWHTQQLCKLQLAMALDCDTAVVIDSDVVVTKSADIRDFHSDSGVVCFARWQKRSALRGKVAHWQAESERLVGIGTVPEVVNICFDTPFVFDQALLAQALADLESRLGKSWWRALLDSPPRRWSEFGFYKAFLQSRAPQLDLDWREPEFSRYLYDSSDPDRVVNQVRAFMQDPAVHYITIHSQAAGRHKWPAEAYLTGILSDLEAGQ